MGIGHRNRIDRAAREAKENAIRELYEEPFLRRCWLATEMVWGPLILVVFFKAERFIKWVFRVGE